MIPSSAIRSLTPQWWWVPLLFLFGCLFYGLSPHSLSHCFSGESLLLIGYGAIAGLCYLALVRWLVRSPWFITMFTLTGYNLVLCSKYLLQSQGTELPSRIIFSIIVGVPAALLFLYHWRYLLSHVRFLRHHLIFISLVIVYYLFYNAQFVDPRIGDLTYAATSQSTVVNVINIALMIIATFLAFYKSNNKDALFDRINQVVLIFNIFQAACCVIGYPVGFFSMEVEGFTRTQGFTIHPNALAHTQAIYLLYTLGVQGYYHRVTNGRKRLNPLLIQLGLVASGLMLLMALSKNALAILGILYCIFGVYSICFLGNNAKFLKQFLVILFLAPILLFAYELVFEQPFLNVLESRMANLNSLEWRFSVWHSLWMNVDAQTALIGHGLSSAPEFVYILKSTLTKGLEAPESKVHSGLLELFYEMGIFGLFYYGIYWAYVRQMLKQFAENIATQYLGIASLLLISYQVIVCSSDEGLLSQPLSSTVWPLLTTLFAYQHFAVRPSQVMGRESTTL